MENSITLHQRNTCIYYVMHMYLYIFIFFDLFFYIDFFLFSFFLFSFLRINGLAEKLSRRHDIQKIYNKLVKEKKETDQIHINKKKLKDTFVTRVRGKERLI